jgi:hypothetical protein
MWSPSQLVTSLRKFSFGRQLSSLKKERYFTITWFISCQLSKNLMYHFTYFRSSLTSLTQSAKSLKRPRLTSNQNRTSPTTKKSSKPFCQSFTELQKSIKSSTMPCPKMRTEVDTILWSCIHIFIILKFKLSTVLSLKKSSKVLSRKPLKNSEKFQPEGL